MIPTRSCFCVLLLALALAAPAQAQGSPGKGRLNVGLSFFDVSGRLGKATALEVAYRPAWTFTSWLRPHAGGMVTSAGGAYGYVGLLVPLSVHPRLRLVPSLSAGAYSSGNLEGLGSVLEFRSEIDLELVWIAGNALVLSFYHLSNAGLAARNPGMEVVGLGYAIRL